MHKIMLALLAAAACMATSVVRADASAPVDGDTAPLDGVAAVALDPVRQRLDLAVAAARAHDKVARVADEIADIEDGDVVRLLLGEGIRDEERELSVLRILHAQILTWPAP